MSRNKKSKKPSSSASRSPSTPLQQSVTDASDERSNRRVLSDAAIQFPHLISESAIRGVVCGTEALSSNHSKIYLPEAFLASCSFCSDHLVSVALAGPDKEPSNKLPLYNFVENYIANFELDACDSLSNNVGSYFAIATVSSCDKLQKNEARLSWALSCTMGFPAIGQQLFISPIDNFSSSHNESNGNITCHLRSHKCRNLNLKMLPFTFIGSVDLASIKNGYGKAELPKARSDHSNLPSPSKNYRRSSGGFYYSVLDELTVKLTLVDEETKLLREKFAYTFLYGRYLLHGNLFAFPVSEKVLFFTVEDAEQHTTFHVEAETKVTFFGTTTAVSESKSGVFLEENLSEFISGGELNDIPILGGLSKEFADLEEIIKFSLAQKDPLLRYSGVLLHGPPGTGKTTLVSCCVREAGARLFLVNGPEIVSQYYGESEQALQKIFHSARTAAPAVVFIDELDAIAPSWTGGGEELSHRMVTTLRQLMDDIKKADGILVIAATNRPDSIDPSLRRPGRFDREIEIGVPSPVQRLDILRTLLNHIDHSLCNAEIESLAFDTHGFVGADLAALCNEAAMTSLCRFISFKSSEELLKCLQSKTRAVDTDKRVPKIQELGKAPCNDDLNSISSLLSELTMSPTPASPDSSCCGPKRRTECCLYDSHGEGQKTLLKVTAEDFLVAKTKVRPSAMREVMLELPKLNWENIGGQVEVKRQLIEAIQWPQKHPDAFKRIGVQPPRGLLMIGPPGCSKTMMARAVASEAKLNFLAVKGPELFSKWVGESEKAVRSIFTKARANAPAIIFFDEIDGLALTRGTENDGTSVADRVLSQLLLEMDGLGQRVGVTVIAATNRPDKIDPALLRPGRFDRILDVQPPNKSDREEIFRIHTHQMPCSPNVSPSELALLTPGYTGADIKLVCREAAVAALEENLEISVVSMEYFRIGISRVPPSEVSFYQKLAEQFRRLVDGGSA